LARSYEQMADHHGDGDHSRSVHYKAVINPPCILTRCPETIKLLEPFCSEFLIHAADNEGLQQGIDVDLVRKLAEWCSIPLTYAGGARTVEDLDLVKDISKGRVDLTIGSALDVFGGSGAKFEDCVAWNRKNS
jgi:phosphoribosylformimino-5-aminoimidazole carboxamide ribotide isomerase